MTEYRYKWVSTVLCGEPDTAAVEKALKQGWEPVDVIPPEIKPMDGFTLEQMQRRLALYRMPESVALANFEARRRQNIIEQNPQTHIDRANKAVAAHVEALNEEHGRTDAGKGWSPIVGNGMTVVGSKQVWTPVTRDWRSEES